jgi:hypothetical protein
LRVATFYELTGILVTFAQDNKGFKPINVDCQKVKAIQSCQSFNEMVASHDKDLTDLFKGAGVVCFRPDEDVFFLITFDDGPILDETKKPPSTFGAAFYQGYQSETSDNSKAVYGKWTKPFGALLFTSTSPGNVNTTIDDSEIFFAFEYKNIGQGITNYSVQVRRSTLRFLETFEWTLPKDNKPAKTAPKAPSIKPEMETKKITNSGYCNAF